MTSTSEVPGRRGRPRSEKAQQAILETARSQLARHGYDRLSIQEVSEAAGVGKQTVYKWWPSKAVLVADCVLEGGLLAEVVALPDTGDARGDIQTWLRALTERIENPEKVSLLRGLVAAAAESEGAATKLFERFTGPCRTVIIERLSAGQRAGQVRRDAPLALVTNALVGALLFRILSREPSEPGDLVRLADVLFMGLGRREGGDVKTPAMKED